MSDADGTADGGTPAGARTGHAVKSPDWRLRFWQEAIGLLHYGDALPGPPERRGAAPAALPGWSPALDLYQRENEITLIVALPGVDPEHTEVVIEPRGLVVRGHRPLAAAIRQASIHRLELPYGHFERRVRLPEGRFRIIRRAFENGCLRLVLHRS